MRDPHSMAGKYEDLHKKARKKDPDYLFWADIAYIGTDMPEDEYLSILKRIVGES